MTNEPADRVEIVEAAPPIAVIPLFEEYLTAHLDDVRQRLSVTLSPAEVLGQDLARLDEFAAPLGCLLIAQEGGRAIGCVGLRSLEDGDERFGELKRLYVRPDGRGRGIGRRLIEAALVHARRAGHRVVRLDTFAAMTAARALYNALGFRVIAPYPGSAIPEQYRGHWTFMEHDI